MVTDTSAFMAAWATIALAAVGALALGVAWWQVCTARRQAKLDRTLRLHRDATTGEVQAAKRRLGALMWRAGEKSAGRRDALYQPSFHELLPAVHGVDGGGRFATYPADIAKGSHDRPLDDLYCILHSFERLYAANRATKALDDDLFKNLAWEIRRWSSVLQKIDGDRTPRAVGLHALAAEVEADLSEVERARLDGTVYVSAE